jgi:hypothetical protein
MRNRSCIDSIDDYKSSVDLSIYRGGGLDPLQTNFRAYPMILANNHGTILGTLICSAHARTVRPPGADCPDRGLSGLRAGPSASAQLRFEQVCCRVARVAEPNRIWGQAVFTGAVSTISVLADVVACLINPYPRTI